MDNTKKCLTCLVDLAIGEFHKDKSRRDGLSVRCKACAKSKTSAWRAANLERSNAAVDAWHKSHPDRVKAIRVAWTERNPGRDQFLKRSWYERSRPTPRVPLTEAQKQEHKTRDYVMRRDQLTDGYVALIMRMRVFECPRELLDAKREQIQMHRLVKELSSAVKDLMKADDE